MYLTYFENLEWSEKLTFHSKSSSLVTDIDFDKPQMLSRGGEDAKLIIDISEKSVGNVFFNSEF